MSGHAGGGVLELRRAVMLPLFLKLADQPVLVVGAGEVASEKIAHLREAGARVRVIAPEACETVREAARRGELTWAARRYRRGDVLGYRLVVAATRDPATNLAVSRDASGWAIPVNVVDVPEMSDVYFGSVLRRGPVTVAVSTSGASPALARRLREYLDQILPRRLESLARALGRARAALLDWLPEARGRAAAAERLLDEFPVDSLDSTTAETIERRVEAWLREVRS